uniref:Single domain-containing protein n=1 Tax=Glossina brevipalpis TaxID=37001 RepID=A0A1A9W6P7_9MUSC
MKGLDKVLFHIREQLNEINPFLRKCHHISLECQDSYKKKAENPILILHSYDDSQKCIVCGYGLRGRRLFVFTILGKRYPVSLHRVVHMHAAMKFLLFLTIICVSVGIGVSTITRGVYRNPDHPGKCVINDNIILSAGDEITNPYVPCGVINCCNNGYLQLNLSGYAIGMNR